MACADALLLIILAYFFSRIVGQLCAKGFGDIYLAGLSSGPTQFSKRYNENTVKSGN